MSRQSPISPKAIAAALWGRKAREMEKGPDWSRNLWQSHPITQRHIQRLMTGDPSKNWIAFIKEGYCQKPRQRALSLGCGDGCAERDIIKYGLARKVHGCDLSAEALESARRQAVSAGFGDDINYFIADMDELELPATCYDLIIAGQSVHHVQNLEGLAEKLRSAIAEDGILVINEYVGPARFQWTDKTNRIMNELLQILPVEKRRKQDGTLKDTIVRPTPEQVIAVDPTESIRPDEIMPVFNRYFQVHYQAGFGGTLLQFLLSEIVANFDEHDSMDQALIDTLVSFEETLIRENVIESDFLFAILQPR